MNLPDGVHLFEDTCNVYVFVRDREAVLVDFGSGRVLDHLAEFGADRVAAVLMTHHHRDQGQGLPRAVAAGIPIWVPPAERDYFDRVDDIWQARPLDNYYDLRDDRFALLAPVPVAGTVPEHRTRRFGGFDVLTVPTPGHTIGSVSYLIDVDGVRVACTGDLIYGPGKVVTLSGTQWSYTGLEGVAASVLSLDTLLDHEPALVLPSHGAPLTEPPAAFALLRTRLAALLNSQRDTHWDLTSWRNKPFEQVSPHLLRNRTSTATTYVLLSESGGALFFDYGYDVITGLATTVERASRRPWLASLPALRRDYGVDRVEVAMPTHYHDDHVAGFNLLREVEGTEIWAEAAVAGVLEQPHRQDLPCLWYEPIGVDRVLAAGEPVRWHEYEITTWPLPGHTRYAVAIQVEVDGARVLATGDQQNGRWSPGERVEYLNFQYKNRFRPDDFIASAALYQRLRPDLMISGHWEPRVVDDAYLAMLMERGVALAALHKQLLPSDVDFGAEGCGARITPYRSRVAPGGKLEVTVTARNPLAVEAQVMVALTAPDGWAVHPPVAGASAPPGAEVDLAFHVVAPDGGPVRRALLGADLTIGEHAFGQHAEALVDVA